MVAELQRLIGLGLSEKEAFTLYMAQLTETPAAPPPPGRQALEERMLDQDRRIEGPDPKMVAEYQERMRTYIPPARDKTFSVVMPVRFAEYVEQWSIWETTKRGRNVTPEDAIQMMVRLHWQADPMRALLAMSGDPHGAVVGTGFDPKTGKFS